MKHGSIVIERDIISRKTVVPRNRRINIVRMQRAELIELLVDGEASS